MLSGEVYMSEWLIILRIRDMLILVILRNEEVSYRFN